MRQRPRLWVTTLGWCVWWAAQAAAQQPAPPSATAAATRYERSRPILKPIAGMHVRRQFAAIWGLSGLGGLDGIIEVTTTLSQQGLTMSLLISGDCRYW